MPFESATFTTFAVPSIFTFFSSLAAEGWKETTAAQCNTRSESSIPFSKEGISLTSPSTQLILLILAKDLFLASTKLAEDEVIKSAMPDEMYKVFHWYKNDEWERFLGATTQWDLDTYLDCLP